MYWKCSAFQLSVVKPKAKQLLWPITTDQNSAMSQSEFEAITCDRRKARENARVQVAIGFGIVSRWLRKWCEISAGQSKRSYHSTLKWKLL